MRDLGDLHYYFLGIHATCTKDVLFLSQTQYAQDILHHHGMTNCKTIQTPVDIKKIAANSGPVVEDPTLYRQLAGALQYLTITCPDIAYAVQQACLYIHDPWVPHFTSLKRILRYLSLGLHLYPHAPTKLVVYANADWDGCPTTRHSTSGYCVFFGNNLVSWSSKRQPTIS